LSEKRLQHSTSSSSSCLQLQTLYLIQPPPIVIERLSEKRLQHSKQMITSLNMIALPILIWIRLDSCANLSNYFKSNPWWALRSIGSKIDYSKVDTSIICVRVTN
jgi:hypothetical protein